MALPTIFPAGYDGSVNDFLKAKVDRSGASKRVAGQISIPASTGTTAIVGLFPFTSGMSFAGLNSQSFNVDDLDSSTNVTISLGVAYQNTTEGTDVLNAIASAATTPQAGGFVPLNATAWMNTVTTGNGWVVATFGAATTTTGNITFNVPVTYDQPRS